MSFSVTSSNGNKPHREIRVERQQCLNDVRHKDLVDYLRDFIDLPGDKNQERGGLRLTPGPEMSLLALTGMLSHTDTKVMDLPMMSS